MISVPTERFVAVASLASATMFICAKAKRQQQCLSVRKRSVSNNNNNISGVIGSTLTHRKANSLERKSPSFKA
ncbi:hypothetical protein [Lysinibacillus sp. FJAT-14222]|uniref:hypothetical protein n=1 Tax=Lysinibacillus sp. FJAT-14222 TaxID=1932366 RepID=UPI000A89E3D3|nr:hypothetical protein [Lysinibacillus sp. FJAT-14222]